MKKYTSSALLSALIAASLINPAYAADGAMSREVVVTASRTEQEVKDTPSSVEVITREDIEHMGAESLEQALKLAMGIDVLPNGMVGNTVSIRGMGSNRTLILIDGRRVRTENTSETANAYELQRVNMDDVEKIEIVRGPVSSLYGSEALGGVINIITRRPDKESTTVTFSATDRQTDQSVSADFGREGKWAWRMSGRHTDTKQRQSLEDSDATNIFGDKYYFNLDGRMYIDDAKTLDVFFDYMKEDSYSHDTITEGTDYDNVRSTKGIAYAGKDDKGDWELRTYYTEFTKDQLIRNKSTNVLTDFENMKFTSWITDGKRSIQAGDNHLLTFGGEYREEGYDGTRVGGTGTHTMTKEGIAKDFSDTDMKYSALYLQDEWLADDKTIIVPSVRYDHSDAFGDKVTAKLGSTYKLSDDSRIKASFGTAYRAPTASELYMKFKHNPLTNMTVNVVGNPNLKPETATNWEVSFEAEKDANFGKATYFKNKVKDMIESQSTYGYDRASRKMKIDSTYVNIGKADIKGVELEAGHHFNDKLTLKAAYAYLDAKDGNSGERLTGRAKDKTSLSLSYDDEKNSGITATLWNDWYGDYLVSETSRGTTTTKSINESILNFVVNKKFSDTYSAYFGIDNLTDKENSYLGLDGRIWRTGVTLKF
jgi:outer membrane receptor for ferrienterochelin and colicins